MHRPLAFRGRWLIGSILVAIMALTCVRLGIWQIDRHFERAELNDMLSDRAEAAARPLGEVLAETSDPSELKYWHVKAAGTFDEDARVLIRGDSLDGFPGFSLVVPLVLDDGRAILVNRGWVPVEIEDDPSIVAPVTGPVVVEGTLEATQSKLWYEVSDPATGTLKAMNRVDIERIQKQSDYDLEPVWISESAIDPPQARDAPIAHETRKSTGSGPHLGYAGQWFAFAIIAIIVWALLLRRAARKQQVS
ncbi:MAG: SURF1 family protein [Acidimicrobiia bacterium]|nr:SURF1 family protein [Acidimicrobiia bacterium]